MSVRVVSTPRPPRHTCGPYEFGYWPERQWDPKGTVVECDCGQTWVSLGRPPPNRHFADMTVRWHREGRFAKWCRLRAQDKEKP